MRIPALIQLYVLIRGLFHDVLTESRSQMALWKVKLSSSNEHLRPI
jgi:hypothetical protein